MAGKDQKILAKTLQNNFEEEKCISLSLFWLEKFVNQLQGGTDIKSDIKYLSNVLTR